MQDFVHLHVHTHFSLLDGQVSVSGLVDKAIKDGMKGVAVTDHGNMFGIKEFYNYVNKKNGALKGEIKKLEKALKALESGEATGEATEKEIERCKEDIREAKSRLFKPIIGCEMYVARRSLDKKEGKPDQSGYHLLVLAKNKTGYKNLLKLVSKAWTKGYYSRPRTDRAELEKYHEGLIVASACLGGEVPKKITQGMLEDAEEAIRWHKNLWGEDYYLELQRHKATVTRANHEVYPLQVQVNEKLIELSRKYNVKLICTNDVHFLDEEHAEAHDRLICLSTGRDIDDEQRMLYSKQEWFKTRQEMNKLFADVPEALSNTAEICEKVEFYSIDHEPILPNFPKPANFQDDDAYLRYLTFKGAKKRWGKSPELLSWTTDPQEEAARIEAWCKMTEEEQEKWSEMNEEQLERVKFELSTVKNMGFPGYFLIVQDFIAAARGMGVSVGPGRGSAAGSAAAYCLGITQIDPIEYDLLFERFLNPDRISLPDIDIDFDDDGRGEVLRWVTEKYGEEKVAHIITYGTMATKSAIKDVARVQKLPLSESDRLSKLVPDRIPDKKINLKNAIEYVPELQAAEASPDPLVHDTIKYAKMLEGTVRNTGVHACGIIICRDDITDWVPVSTADDKETGEKMLVTQYEGSIIEETGLIKMDFLGLKTLSIIKEAVSNIKDSKGEELDIDAISITDELTYKLYSEGKTVGTFQFESAGMQKYLRELQPSTFEDLIAMNALYRPGPMDYIPQFIDRKHGREPIQYDIPIMEKYLKETYGITVYQEQVMLLSRLLADFTRGESDALRKAMGKKLRDKLDQMKPKFISGGQKNGYDPKVLEKIWSDWEKFASYAFNKSHATCYSWVAYQTAYLKAHYPSEYMAAVLSRNISNITEITKFMDECKSMNILVLGPDVNESRLKFTVNQGGNIRFGLGAIKGVGEGAVESIVSERQKNGPFKSIFDFVQRVNLNACNKKNMESLALAGAFDQFKGITREQFFVKNGRDETFLEVLMRYGNKYQTDKAVASNSLFGGENVVEIATPEILPAEKWSDLERLNREKDLVGIYLSAHPLDEYSIILNHVCNTRMAEFNDLSVLSSREITMGGVVTSVRTGFTKKGNPYGVVKIEDYSGSAEFALFSNDWLQFQSYFMEGMFLYMRGKVQPKQWKNSELEFKFSTIELLPQVKEKLVEKLTISVPLTALDVQLVTELVSITKSSPGNTELYFRVADPLEEQMKIELMSHTFRLNVGKELITYLNEHPELAFRIN